MNVKIETETETIGSPSSLRDWFVLGVETDGQNVAHYASRSHSRPFPWEVFFNGERIAGPFPSISKFELAEGTLAFVAGHQGAQYVYKGTQKIAGPFEYVSALFIKNGMIIFAAEKDGSWYVYVDRERISGPFLKVNCQIRMDDSYHWGGFNLLYLAQDEEGWFLFNWEMKKAGPFEMASNLFLKEDHVHFVARQGDYWCIILDGQIAYQHEMELWGNELKGNTLVYVGRNEEGLFRFRDGEVLDGPYDKCGLIRSCLKEGEYHAILRKEGEYYLYRDREQMAGPFEWATGLVVKDNTAYYLAKPYGGRLFAPLQLMYNGESLGEVGSDHVHLQLLAGIPVVTHSGMASTVVNVMGKRVDSYDQVSDLFVQDGSITFFAATTYDLVKVRVLVDQTKAA